MKKLFLFLAFMMGAFILVRRFVPADVRKALGEKAMGRMMASMPDN